MRLTNVFVCLTMLGNRRCPKFVGLRGMILVEVKSFFTKFYSYPFFDPVY